MSIAHHVSEDDLYLYALQLLPESEMQAASLHLKECAVCRSQVGEIQGDLAVYALTAEMQAPPSQARERLLQQVAKEKKIVPVSKAEQQIEPVLYPRNSRMFQMEAPEEREPKRTAVFMAWAGWVVAAGVAVVAGLQFNQRQIVERNLSIETAKLDQTSANSAKAQEVLQTLTDVNAMQVSLHVPLTAGALPKADPEAHAVYVPSKGSLVFVASHLDPLQPNKTYELWLLPAEAGKAPIPAGLFKPDATGSASFAMPELPKNVAAKGFGVTVENEGGSTTPTAPIVLAGL
jgi:hypothetical protein